MLGPSALMSGWVLSPVRRWLYMVLPVCRVTNRAPSSLPPALRVLMVNAEASVTRPLYGSLQRFLQSLLVLVEVVRSSMRMTCEVTWSYR